MAASGAARSFRPDSDVLPLEGSPACAPDSLEVGSVELGSLDPGTSSYASGDSPGAFAGSEAPAQPTHTEKTTPSQRLEALILFVPSNSLCIPWIMWRRYQFVRADVSEAPLCPTSS